MTDSQAKALAQAARDLTLLKPSSDAAAVVLAAACFAIADVLKVEAAHRAERQAASLQGRKPRRRGH